MNYGNIKYCDIANGPGVRTSLFVSGCRHHCKGCFQPETWDFSFGAEFNEKLEDEILKSLEPDYIAGFTCLGGEPMEPENQPHVLHLIRRIREKFPEKNIWIYSGYTFEELTDPENKACHTEYTAEILSLLDCLVDGEFHLDKKDLMLKFRGSSNQRILDMQKSIKENSPVWNEEFR